MEVHHFEKLWTALAILLIVAFIGTVTYGAVGAGVTMVSDSGGQVDAANLDQHPQFGDPGVRQVGPDHYAVYIVSEQFQFRPGTNNPIRVPADTKITFYITTSDVTHGFNLVGTNVNVMVIPGQVSQISVTFDEPGSYGIVCHEYCGAGHHTMEGSLVVVPESQYEDQQ